MPDPKPSEGLDPIRDRRSPKGLWCRVFFWGGVGLLLLSSPCIFFGVLGNLGVLADVSPAENRDFGMGFLRLALIPLGSGVVCLLVAALLRRRG
jgi:hypothetical protein